MHPHASQALKLSTIINCTAITLLAALIIATNLYVISQAKKFQKVVRSVPKYLLANQAIGDLLVGLVYIPAVIIDCYMNVNILRYVTCPLFFNGLFARCIIAFDRYISIAEPLRHRVIMHFGRVRLILQVFLCLTVSLDIVPLFWIRASAGTSQKADLYFQMLLCVLITLALLVLLSVYILTFRKARKFFNSKICCNTDYQMWIVHRVTSTEKLYLAKQRRLTVQFAVLAISFVATYMPILYINFVAIILKKREYTPRILIDISSYLYIINALFSPIFSIYQQRVQANSKAFQKSRLKSKPNYKTQSLKR